MARLEAAHEGVDDPGVDGDALACGNGLDVRLEALGKPERDARAGGLVGGARGGLVLDDHELRLAAGQPHFDPDVAQLLAELERRLGQRLEQAPSKGGLERDAEQLCCPRRVLVAEGGDGREVFLERLNIAFDLHGSSMTSQ